jgi:hypothetical protein
VGQIIADSHVFKTLELPWLNNQSFFSCIPTGQYVVKQDKTGKHQFYSITNVYRRTDIEIHIANKVEDLLGCIGLGTSFDIKYNLLNSKVACNKFVEIMGDDDFMLSIRDFNSFIDEWV